jgi:DNA-binding MarR family transcriptional regulator/GNAT superfamily N-acetyltransferase
MGAEQVERVRDFNRYYTRRLGILTDSFLGRGRSLAEARLLFEIGSGADVRDLRSRLGLDSGYLSRLLRALEGQELVRVRAHDGDGRVRVAELTEAGAGELAEINRRSDAGTGEVLDRLSGPQREQLVAAQEQVRRLMRLAAVVIEPEDAGSATARRCLDQYAAELAVRFPEGYDASALISPDEATGFLVAREEGRPIGCGGWHPLKIAGDKSAGDESVELCHLWVHPDARGLGVARRLLGALEEGIAAQGHAVVRLGTHNVLPEAISLYRSAGYRQIPLYDDSRYNKLAFEKVLAPG